MKTCSAWLARVALAGAFALAAIGTIGSAVAAGEIRIITVMDNEVVDPNLKANWGFAAAVVTPTDTLLFDTGPVGGDLLDNLAKLGLDPKQFAKVMISHLDDDHAAGLSAFVAANPNVEVYMPGRTLSAMNETKAGEIAPGLITTGSMGSKPDQALLIETREGMVIMTGCAHPGIIDVIKEAERLNPGKRVLLVMGGFHLFQTADSKVDLIVHEFKKLKVEKVAPSHCSGRYARTRFKEVYGADYIAGGVGLTLSFPAP